MSACGSGPTVKAPPWWACILLSLMILTPCFWHSRIHAGDLSSHAYNAWLTLLIERGEAPGLYLVKPWTNVLFDILLTETMRAFGPDWAQRISVSICVLIFFWGAFVWVRAWTRKPAWNALPLIALATYGLVFNFGFFNFYLGVGLGLWGASLLAEHGRWRLAVAAVLFAAAAYSHALACAATLAVALFQLALKALPLKGRLILTSASVALIVFVGMFLPMFAHLLPSRSSYHLFGVDQLAHAGTGTFVVAALFTPLVILFLIFRLQDRRLIRSVGDRFLQLLAVVSAALIVLPGGVVLADYVAPLSFLQERLSLLGLLCLLLVWVRLTPPRWAIGAVSALCLVSFFSVYVETVYYQRLEETVGRLVQTSPAGSRVVSTLQGSMTASDLALHMVDRACIGHCFSYANYEPVSTAFRVRARVGNGIVMTDPQMIELIQSGDYRVRLHDLPLWVVSRSASTGEPTIHAAVVGERLNSSVVRSDTAERLLGILPPERH